MLVISDTGTQIGQVLYPPPQSGSFLFIYVTKYISIYLSIYLYIYLSIQEAYLQKKHLYSIYCMG